jgi:hypothetical protein
MASFVQRVIGATRLEMATYEEVKADPGATWQAVAVVAVAAIASGVGSVLSDGGTWATVAGLVPFSLVAWLVFAVLAHLVGTRILPSSEARSSLAEMLRTTGFATAPGSLGLFGSLPLIGALVTFAATLLGLGASVIAVRQALSYTSTVRAVGVCLIVACLIGLIGTLLVVLAMVGGVLPQTDGAAPQGAMP